MTTQRTIAALAGAAALVLLSGSAAGAQDAASRGRRVVDEWCRLCHLRAGQPPRQGMAPAYETIVRLPGRDEAYFTRFLHEDHFPMTTFRLFEAEKQDVVAYLMWLQRRGQRR
jgi:mono/diheme cytochrome c family protein